MRSSGVAQISEWAPEPAPDAENPLLATVDEGDWPATPAGRHYEAVREAAALVAAAAETSARDRHARRRGPGAGPGVAAGTPSCCWPSARNGGAAATAAIPVQLPARLSVSALVSLARDPAELARQVRRPMPRPPARQARKGTAFHEWLERRYGQQRLIDDTDLFGPGEPGDGENAGENAGESTDLSQLRTRFEHSEWADRWPRAVEVPFETLIGDRLIRGRIDAVFADAPGGGYDVVDWKTGRPPASDAERHAVSVQLAAYRLAWATLAGVPVTQVRAAFHYVADDLTVRPADLLDETGLTTLITQIPARRALICH